MIISRTPFRMSFFGGGTDYPEWYLREGGAVLSTTFDKYFYINCRSLPPFFEHKYRIAYSKIENTKEIKDIEHPAIQAVLRRYNFNTGIELSCVSDLPARSGLGSSSALIVGLINALNALDGRVSSKNFLTNEAIEIEQNILKETVGSQDQTACAHGGFNKISFLNDGGITVSPIILKQDRKAELNDHLMLFFTGFSRFASDVAKSQVSNIKIKKEELIRMLQMVDEAIAILNSDQDIRDFGKLLDYSWQTKRTLSDQITNSEVDKLYQNALKAGAIGGKLLGAGGGGFLLLFVQPENQQAVKRALKHLVHVPFTFETSGSQIIYFN